MGESLARPSTVERYATVATSRGAGYELVRPAGRALSCMPLCAAGMSRGGLCPPLFLKRRRFMRSSSELQSGAAIEHTGRSKDSNASPKAADAPRKRSKLQFVVLHRNWRHKTRVTRHKNPRT